MQTLLLLWSINERLSGREGLELTQPDQAWIADLLTMEQRDAEGAAEAKRERIEQAEKQALRELFYG